MTTIERFGERATLVDLEDPKATPATTIAIARHLERALPGADVVVGAGTLLVDGVSPDRVGAALEAAASQLGPHPVAEPSRLHEVAVRYDGEDLDEVARAAGLPRAAVIQRHADRDYTVEIVGFLPGFAYLGAVNPALVLPRRASPRKAVPARSVAIAGAHTGVYPFASPGGWHLLGRAVAFSPFDPARAQAVALTPGDRVRFAPTDAPFVEHAVPAASRARAERGLEVLLAPAGATVQDGGRRGLLGRGIPPSGPLDEDAHALANAALGNALDAAAIEVPLGALDVRAVGGAVHVAVDGEPARRLAPGDRLRVEPGGRAVRYLAVRGGVDLPPALGARATLLVARIGGLSGGALRKGDVVPVSGEEGLAGPVARAGALDATRRPLSVMPGPHRARFPPGAFERFVASSFVVSPLGDRVGQRLDGQRIERFATGSSDAPTPMIRGAVQITTDGTPVVLGPDHPTTGGYPVLAVLTRASCSALARRLPGERVTFQADPI